MSLYIDSNSPKRSRIFGVSSASGAGGAAKGFEADAVDLNFSMAASLTDREVNKINSKING